MKKWTALERRRCAAVGAVVVLAGGALTGCTIERDGRAAEPPAATTTTEAPDEPPAISVKDGSEDIEPGVPVKVTSAAGLRDVTMTNEDGKVVKSETNADKTEWVTAEPLGYGRTYTVEATTSHGTTATSTFTTVVPAAQASVSIGPMDGSTVGIAEAISFYFDIAPTDRKSVEEAITVTTSNDTEGAFFWLDANQLRWRPKEYWEPGTEVTVNADVYGRKFGGGVYGAEDNSASFTIGDDVRTVVDNSSKTLTVYRNGQALRTIPVSLGTDGTFDTPNGIYVVGDEHETLKMDSRTYGLGLDEGGYVTTVNYATQMSWSGVYVHGAPWAVDALGNYNQSHGCVNATPSDAQWFMETVKRGDPVEVKNTKGETLSGYDGLGYWNIDWETWQQGNADG